MTPLLTDASSRKKPTVSVEHVCRWQYRSIFIRFHIVVADRETEQVQELSNHSK